MLALGKGEQLPVEPCGSSDQNDVIRYRPQGSLPLVRRCLLLVIFLVDVWWPNWHASFDTHASVEPRQSHPIAECMCEYTREHVPGAEVCKCCEEAEERSVRELEQRAEHGDEEWHFCMRDAKLVEVVHMRYAKVQRRQEDDLRPRIVAEHMQWHDA